MTVSFARTDWAMLVSLTESRQHFWEELIGHDALSSQLIAKPLGDVGRRSGLDPIPFTYAPAQTSEVLNLAVQRLQPRPPRSSSKGIAPRSLAKEDTKHTEISNADV